VYNYMIAGSKRKIRTNMTNDVSIGGQNEIQYVIVVGRKINKLAITRL